MSAYKTLYSRETSEDLNAAAMSSFNADITKCNICLHILTNPRILPCIDTFCLKCLEKKARELDWKVGEKIPCPRCSCEFELPVNGVSGIKSNVFVEKIIKLEKLTQPRDSKELCEQCIKRGTQKSSSKAELYCVQCDEELCQTCKMDHTSQKQYDDHKVEVIGSPNMVDFNKYAPTFCRTHANREIALFCCTCNEAICLLCSTINHQSHRSTFSELSKAAENIKKEISDFVQTADRFADDTSRIKVSLVQTQDEFMKSVDRIETEINETANELIDRVEQSRASLLSLLEQLTIKANNKHEMQKKKFIDHFIGLETFKVYCNEILSKGSDADICDSIKDLKARYADLRRIQKVVKGKKSISSISIIFKRSDIEKRVREHNNCVGIVQERSSDDGEPAIVTAFKRQFHRSESSNENGKKK